MSLVKIADDTQTRYLLTLDSLSLIILMWVKRGVKHSILETMMLLKKIVDGKAQLHHKHLNFHAENQPGLLGIRLSPSQIRPIMLAGF